VERRAREPRALRLDLAAAARHAAHAARRGDRAGGVAAIVEHDDRRDADRQACLGEACRLEQ